MQHGFENTLRAQKPYWKEGLHKEYHKFGGKPAQFSATKCPVQLELSPPDDEIEKVRRVWLV
jgi:hypothetical protein